LRTSYFSNLDSGAGPLKRQNTDTVTLFFPVSQDGGLARHTAADAGATVQQSQRCTMDCSGSITVASLRWLGCGGCGDIPQGGTGIALAASLAFWPCAHRLQCRYTTQWDAGVALAGCYEPTCQVLLFQSFLHTPGVPGGTD